MQISNSLAMLNSAQSTNSRLKTQILQNANSFESELAKADLVQQNLVSNTQIQSESATNSQQKSEFENVMSTMFAKLENEGKIDELKNVFSFVTSAVAILKFREQKDMLELSDISKMIDILNEPYTLQAGTYLGQSETAEHFNARKNQAIDYLNELLVQI